MSQSAFKNFFFLIIFFSVPSNAQFAAFIHADSRSEAMGGTGYALADDESALFYNPAGLGIRNQRLNGGASNYAEIPFNFIRTFSGYCQLNRVHPIGFASYLNSIYNRRRSRVNIRIQCLKNNHLLDIASEASIVNNFYFDDLSVNNLTFNTGVEAVLSRTIAGRFGFQINKYAIKKFSITAGYGICLFNHFEFHFYMNQRNGFDITPDAGGSINFTRMLKYEKADLR